MNRRQVLRGLGIVGLVIGAGGLLAACAPSEPAPPSHEQAVTERFLQTTGESLLGLGIESHGGLTFESRVQGGNRQVDRDVGVAGTAMGLLAMANQYPGDSRWLASAEKSAAWLTAVSSTVTTADGSQGRYWHDYINPDGSSSDVYTSFDDGALGIGDFYWRLYKATGKGEYKQTSLETLNWTFAQAENLGSASQPVYRWKWDATDPSQSHYMGMGMGVTGVIETLATYYQRLEPTDPAMATKCKQYIDGALRYLDRSRAQLASQIGDSRYAQALPYTEPNAPQDANNGNTEMDSGYLSGAAGAAFMYLKLQQVFGNSQNTQYLSKANELFGWLGNDNIGPLVRFNNGTVAWKIAVDPEGGNNNRYATGIEEGNAGIGWVYLQAYNLTKQQQYLTMATKAADWLLSVSQSDGHGGMYWHEDMNPTNPLTHKNLDNGAAGVGFFLEDLYQATGDSKYHQAAQGALAWLMHTAKQKGSRIYWTDNSGYTNGNSGPTSAYQDDPSWHWGDAGIMAFTLRMLQGQTDMPGEESGLLSRF